MREYNPTQGSGAINTHQFGWYGHRDYHTSVFDGSEFWLQLRVKRDLARGTNGVGKSVEILQAARISPSHQTLVTYSSLSLGGAWRAYAYWDGRGAFPIQQQAGRIASETTTVQPGGVLPLWTYSGGWDTLMYHFIPGHEDTVDTRFEVYAAREGETQYTLITSGLYQVTSFLGQRGWQALALMTYNNGETHPAFTDRYDQIILSQQSIPCPQA